MMNEKSNKTEMGRNWKILALILLFANITLHIAAMMKLFVAPFPLFFLLSLLVVIGFLRAIADLLGFSIRPFSVAIAPSSEINRAIVNGLRFVPLTLRVLGLGFWFVYAPVIFFWGMLRSFSNPEESQFAFSASSSVVMAALSLWQYYYFRFVLPLRNELFTQDNDRQ